MSGCDPRVRWPGDDELYDGARLARCWASSPIHSSFLPHSQAAHIVTTALCVTGCTESCRSRHRHCPSLSFFMATQYFEFQSNVMYYKNPLYRIVRQNRICVPVANCLTAVTAPSSNPKCAAFGKERTRRRPLSRCRSRT